MANRNEIGYGATGSDVSYLQNQLNKLGYNLSVDGIFGTKTQQAVKDYQQKNGLKVDGIVGVNTWGSLTGTNTGAAKQVTNTQIKTPGLTQNTAANGSAYTPSTSVSTAKNSLNSVSNNKPGAYQQSDAVTQAQAMLQQQLASKPGAYQSQWQGGIDEIVNQILNREKFSYDMDGDAMYQQYKDLYTMQGQQAMMDTMGQAQAMTGGYGNSYAQTVGQQVYQGYMQQLGEIVPELYQMALDQYNREGDEMYQQYGLLTDRESQDYGRYQDSVDAWEADYDRAYQQYMNERDFDYGQHRDQVSDWNNAYDQAYQKYLDELNFDYGQHRDAVADQQWEDSFQYQKDRDAVSDSQWQAEFDEAKRQYDQNYGLKTATGSGSSGGSSSGSGSGAGGSSGGSGGGNGGSSGDSGGSGYNNGGVSDSNIKRLQNALGVTADGKWGPESQAAAKKKWGTTDASKCLNIYNNADNSAARSNQFSGSTYDAAYGYAKANGFDFTYFHPMTESEWNSRRSSGSTSPEVTENKTYKDYIQDYVAYYISEHGK